MKNEDVSLSGCRMKSEDISLIECPMKTGGVSLSDCCSLQKVLSENGTLG